MAGNGRNIRNQIVALLQVAQARRLRYWAAQAGAFALLFAK
jgi:hypothetical protein